MFSLHGAAVMISSLAMKVKRGDEMWVKSLQILSSLFPAGYAIAFDGKHNLVEKDSALYCVQCVCFVKTMGQHLKENAIAYFHSLITFCT